MSKIAWKAYEEVHFSDQYILRWVREGDEYANRITKEMMEDLKSVVRQQQAEIEALKKKIQNMALDLLSAHAQADDHWVELERLRLIVYLHIKNAGVDM